MVRLGVEDVKQHNVFRHTNGGGFTREAVKEQRAIMRKTLRGLWWCGDGVERGSFILQGFFL